MKKLLVILLVLIMTLSAVPASYASDEELTRSEALVTILKFFDLYDYAQETEYENIFSDVPEDYWAAGSILYAYNLGITKGTFPGKFSPERKIQVGEFLTLVIRYASRDIGITPENVFDMEMTKYVYDEYFNNAAPEEIDTVSASKANDILEKFDWINDSAIESVDYSDYRNIVQVGERMTIPLEEIEGLSGYKYEVEVSDKSLIQYTGRRSDSHLFRALKSGKATIHITIAAPGEELLEERIYEFYILEEGKGEGVFELYEGGINEIPLGCTALIKLDSNPTTGYSWEMAPNDNIELIQERYIADPIEEEIVGSGGMQILTFLMNNPGETELVLKYVRSWEPDEENAPEYRFDIIITDNIGTDDIGIELDNYANDVIDGTNYTFPPYYYFTTVAQSGENLHIPLEDDYTYEIDISDESLLIQKEVSSDDYYVFEALDTGRVTILMSISDIDGELTENRIYEIVIVKNREEILNISENEINEVPIGAVFSLTFEANASTGYSWEMMPNDNIELIYKDYYHYPVEEGLVGTGGCETLTFLMIEPGETQLVLKYAQSWDPENEPGREVIFDIIITE